MFRQFAGVTATVTRRATINVRPMTTPIAESLPAVSVLTSRGTMSQPRSRYVCYFFVGMAVVFILITALGFVPQLIQIQASHIQLHWLTNVHGAVMTGWLLLFLTQSVLAARGKLKYHRQLGLLSIGLGALVWITMGTVTISALIRDNPPELDRQFATVALSLASVALFGLFFTWGILARRNPGVHKRLLVLAMLPLMSAGIDRIVFLPGLGGVYFLRFIYVDALLIPLVFYDFATVGRIHRMTVIGMLWLLAEQVAVGSAADSTRWHHFAYTAITPFVERIPEVRLTDAQSAPLLGDYGDKDWKMTVSRDGGRLYLQMPGQEKWELGSYGENELFVKIMAWRMSFTKNAEGKVTKLTNTQPSVTWEKPRFPAP